mgnify:CR=1 FL=1
MEYDNKYLNSLTYDKKERPSEAITQKPAAAAVNSYLNSKKIFDHSENEQERVSRLDWDSEFPDPPIEHVRWTN